MRAYGNISAASNEVHVWWVELVRPEREVEDLLSLLSLDERERAARFRFAGHRDRFTVARGTLRRVLGHYAGVSPESVRFEYGANGKPSLPDSEIRFNLSHSGDIAMIGITRSREIGVDVERMRQDKDLLDIAERFFAPREREALRDLSEEEQRDGFFRCWTRKEAYLKALGAGLSLNLHGFVVSLAPGEPAALLDSEQGAAEAARWSLVALEPHPDYAAAVAVEGASGEVRELREELGA
ncbi:MAG TPA: 4'-phosphopantetheinyl transferase superfamily protein [Bryobacteraceae bacterium]|nr:4'-phosphopantetheinyl transferase superfamily protein [Bryobacteraceae bacterium]